jgi:small GTP-binding protein
MEGVKFILLGDGSVGKTCLMLSFTGKSFRVAHIKTIGIDMDKRNFNFQGKELEVKIWDTAGQERYRNSLPKDLFHRLNGALLVYDVTQRKTFNSVSSWMKLIEENAPPNTAVILVANKVDKEIDVSEAEGRALADKFSIPFIMTSAKTGQNVEKAFEDLLSVTVRKNPKIMEENNQNNQILEPAPKRKYFCC